LLVAVGAEKFVYWHRLPNIIKQNVSLAKPSHNYFSTVNDYGHCPAAVRAGEWTLIIHLGCVQRDTFAAAQTGNPGRGASGRCLMLAFMAG